MTKIFKLSCLVFGVSLVTGYSCYIDNNLDGKWIKLVQSRSDDNTYEEVTFKGDSFYIFMITPDDIAIDTDTGYAFDTSFDYIRGEYETNDRIISFEGVHTDEKGIVFLDKKGEPYEYKEKYYFRLKDTLMELNPVGSPSTLIEYRKAKQ